jgi:hypothetical protein
VHIERKMMMRFRGGTRREKTGIGGKEREEGAKEREKILV